MINGSPEIKGFAVDPDENLVQMPPPLRSAPIRGSALLPDLGCKQRAEPVPPEPDRLVRDIDPAFMEQILHVTERKWEADIHHHRKADDFR